MKERKPPVAMSLWLVPCESEVNDWQQLIDCLAAEHDGPPFTAHVTSATIGLAHLDPQHLMSDAINWLAAVAGDFGPLTLTVSPPTIGDSFFECVFCDLPTAPVAELGQSFLALASNSQVLTGLQNIQKQKIRTQSTQRAHMSLLYGSINTDQKAHIAKTFSWPAGRLTLDTLVLVGPGEGQTDFANPQAWEMLGSAKLTGEPVTV